MVNKALSTSMRLNVQVWAEVVRSAGKPLRGQAFNIMFDRRGSARRSTGFDTCLARGTPRPNLRYPEGNIGIALKIEAQVRGSLKWLVHPLWGVLDVQDVVPVEEVWQLMSSLEPKVSGMFFEGPQNSLRRRGRTTIFLVEKLAQLGTLDALAACVYLALEAEATSDRTGLRAVVRGFNRWLDTWSCLTCLSERTRGSFGALIYVFVESRVIATVDRSVALAETATKVLQHARGLGHYPSPFPARYLDDVAALEKCLIGPAAADPNP